MRKELQICDIYVFAWIYTKRKYIHAKIGSVKGVYEKQDIKTKRYGRVCTRGNGGSVGFGGWEMLEGKVQSSCTGCTHTHLLYRLLSEKHRSERHQGTIMVTSLCRASGLFFLNIHIRGSAIKSSLHVHYTRKGVLKASDLSSIHQNQKNWWFLYENKKLIFKKYCS